MSMNLKEGWRWVGVIWWQSKNRRGLKESVKRGDEYLSAIGEKNEASRLVVRVTGPVVSCCVSCWL